MFLWPPKILDRFWRVAIKDKWSVCSFDWLYISKMFGLVTMKGTSQHISRPAFRSRLAHQQFPPTAMVISVHTRPTLIHWKQNSSFFPLCISILLHDRTFIEIKYVTTYITWGIFLRFVPNGLLQSWFLFTVIVTLVTRIRSLI